MASTTFGQKLIALRGSRTIADVATALGISRSALNMYEIGSRVPRDEIKEKLAKFYGTTVGALFYGEESHVS